MVSPEFLGIPEAQKKKAGAKEERRSPLSMVYPESMEEIGYFFVADVLGFSEFMLNTESVSIDARIGQWVSVVESAKAICGVERCKVFSDTIFSCAPSSEGGLKDLVAFARELLTRSLEHSFLVRGGIAHGLFTWGDLIYGRAVIEAHRLETRQNWIGVACQGGLPHVKTLWGVDQVVCYLPPMKQGLMKAMPAISWKIPDSKRLTELVMSSNTIRDGDFLTWEIGEKISNTLLFRSYLLILAKESLDPSLFHGPLPSQVLDEVLSKRTYS